MRCFFVSDLHGNLNKYEKLFRTIYDEKPDVVLLGGDLLPRNNPNYFLFNFLESSLIKLKNELKDAYPEILLILGNNDPKTEEKYFIEISNKNLWHYIHNKQIKYDNYKFIGYSYSPPSPFMLKDWEKYDISTNVEEGCISPENGITTTPVDDKEKFSTIKNDLDAINSEDIKKSIFLFHAPPFKTNLDVIYDYNKKMNKHTGSKAIRKFIENKQPYITLHGHIHESSRLSGSWKDKIGNTYCFSAAYDGNELAIINFELDKPENATRVLI